VLRRTDSSEGQSLPLVTIRFSEEAREQLGTHAGDVGRGMIGAGMQIVGQLQGAEGGGESVAPPEESPRTLH
jgi:hypothetical protein